MPEGPEVRTLVDQLQGGVGKRLNDLKFLSGRYVRGPKPTGFKEFAKTMTADNPKYDTIEGWRCRGKFIYVILDGGSNSVDQKTDFKRSIWITLGMTGRFVSEQAHNQTKPHQQQARWMMELLDPETLDITRIYYYDTRNFGTLRFSTSQQELLEKLESLGPDIFYMDENDFVALVSDQRRERNICKFLMDQSKLSGIGNYMLSEGLYRSGVDPFGSIQELDETQQRMLFREMQAVAVSSYESQGLTRQKGGEYRTVEGNRGEFEFELQCYGRDFCARGHPVRRETNGPHGRTIWYVDEQLVVPRQERALQIGSVRSEKEDDDGDSLFVVEKLKGALTEPSWCSVLRGEFRRDYFRSLAAYLEVERKSGAVIFPPPQDIFSAFNVCPFDKVKVVIVVSVGVDLITDVTCLLDKVPL